MEWFILTILVAVVLVMMFKPEWANRALGWIAAAATGLAIFGTQIMEMIK